MQKHFLKQLQNNQHPYSMQICLQNSRIIQEQKQATKLSKTHNNKKTRSDLASGIDDCRTHIKKTLNT